MLKILQRHDALDRGDMKVADTTSQSYETKLVEKLHLGDNAATEEFHNVYRNRIYHLVLRHVDQNQAIAEDLVQEIFLAALSSIDKFRGDSQLYTWLRSIALHKINDFYRRQAREPESKISSDLDTIKSEQIGASEQAVHNAIESEEIRQSVHQALEGLPQDYQKVLVLKYLDEMPVLEISQVMGRSPKSVEGLLSRARKAMRAELEENDQET
jgi:RNA polymerase sigma-70 factor (ECF subfamily)